MSNNALTTGVEVAQLVVPLVPSIISFVQSIFGDGNGAAKKQAAVDLLHGGLTTLANAGKIPSSGVVDPTLPNELGNVVQKAFDQITAPTGKVPSIQPPATASPAPSTALGSFKSMVVSGAGRNFIITELL